MKTLYKSANKKELEALNMTVNTMLRFTSETCDFVAIIFRNNFLEAYIFTAQH